MAKRILLDPGHGGVDPGVVAKTGQREDRTNFNVCSYLQQFLKAAGFAADITRWEQEQTVSVNERMAMVRAKPYDLVVSVHHNGGGGDGAEICVQINNQGKNYDEKALKFANLLLAEFQSAGQNLRKSPILRKANSTGREDYFGVLRAAAGKGIPAVITEFAFLDSKDVQLVDTYTEQKTEARVIAEAVKKFLQ